MAERPNLAFRRRETQVAHIISVHTHLSLPVRDLLSVQTGASQRRSDLTSSPRPHPQTLFPRTPPPGTEGTPGVHTGTRTLPCAETSSLLCVHLLNSSARRTSSPEARSDAPKLHVEHLESRHAAEERVGGALHAVFAARFCQELVQASSEVAVDRGRTFKCSGRSPSSMRTRRTLTPFRSRC